MVTSDVNFSEARKLTERAIKITELNKAREHEQKLAKCQPLNDRVLVRRIEQENDNLVQTPDVYKPKSNVGEVLSIGHRVVSLKVGDKVMFGEYSAQDVVIDGENLVLLSLHDIWVKL